MSNQENEIWRSTELGNELTPPVRVTRLPAKELKVQQEIAEANVQIDIAKRIIEEWKHRITALRSSCKHHYFNDTAGFPYDTRRCVVCGKHMGNL